MSLPPLPDIFGNYALGEFNEVVSPPPVDWMPQTPGWYVVGALLLALLLRKAWHWLRHWHRNRYRREALRRLQSMEPGEALLAEVNQLLKLSAMAAFSRSQVASLSGAEWPGFLNALCETPPFGDAECELLSVGVYRQDSIDPPGAERLLLASRAWVRQHRNRYDD